jgi:hypothetical protein
MVTKTNGREEKLDETQPSIPDIHSLPLHWTRSARPKPAARNNTTPDEKTIK